MKDRNGNELAIGDRVLVASRMRGFRPKLCFVRSVKDESALVDDGTKEDNSRCGWSLWVDSKRIEKL